MICREPTEWTPYSRPRWNYPLLEVGAGLNAVLQVNRSARAVLSTHKKVRELDFYNKWFCWANNTCGYYRLWEINDFSLMSGPQILMWLLSLQNEKNEKPSECCWRSGHESTCHFTHYCTFQITFIVVVLTSGCFHITYCGQFVWEN